MIFAAAVAALPAAPAESAPANPAAARPAALSAADVIAHVRRAVGHRNMKRLRYGLAIAEKGEGNDSPATRLFGKAGAVRDGSEFGYDGRVAWQLDSRRGSAAPMNLRQFEKLAWPLWIRSGRWLDRDSGITATLLTAESDSRHVALRLERRGGVVPATLFVDRSTWLPARLVVPYDRGPFTALYSDYRSALGMTLPFRVESEYRNRSTALVTSVRPLARAEANFAMAQPADYGFDDRVPALLELRRGTPIAAGDPGHVYAQPEVDGKTLGWFLFDSGADGMMIDSRLADELGMPVIGRTNSIGADGTPRPGTFRRGKTFRLGRLTIENPVYLAVDLSANNAPAGAKRAGVIGYDLLARAVVEFHGTGDRIALCNPARYRLPGAARWQPLGFMDSTPAIRTSFEGRRTGLFQLDTGSAASVDFYPAFTQRERLLEGRVTREHRSQGAGGTFPVAVGRLKDFTFGGRHFRDLEVSFRTGGVGRDGGAGVIGRELMAGFTTIFDYPNRRVSLAPLRSVSSPCGE
jgi:hypothetical protein